MPKSQMTNHVSSKPVGDAGEVSSGTVKARFENVSKAFDTTLVVEDLCLDVFEGEFLTLLGASGSGKTTSLMMLAGFESPTSGEIFLNGRSVQNVPPHRRGMGIVFQNYSLFPHMTISENIAYPLRTRRVPREEIASRVSEALAMVRLENYGSRRPSQLSGGQQQRVALARALVFEPELVLMDEPLGALDKNLRESMQSEISQLHRDLGATIVYVTHDQTEALSMSTRVAIFDRGKIQQTGSPREIYERPATSFVAGFVGQNNSLPGKVCEVKKDVATVELINGATVRARSTPHNRVGDPATVSVRPERLKVTTKPPSAGQGLKGTVSELVYLGDQRRGLIAVPGLCDVVVRINHFDQIETGDTVWLGWSVEDASALDAGATAPSD